MPHDGMGRCDHHHEMGRLAAEENGSAGASRAPGLSSGQRAFRLGLGPAPRCLGNCSSSLGCIGVVVPSASQNANDGGFGLMIGSRRPSSISLRSFELKM